jgi:aminopeptidase N
MVDPAPEIPKEVEDIKKAFGDSAYLEDPEYKLTAILKKTEAVARKKHVRDVLYHFRIGVRAGDYYIGNASIKFYIDAIPENMEELFLNCQVRAITDLTVNGHSNTDADSYKDHKIHLKADQLKAGWNSVEMKYFQIYSKLQVGLHTYTDSQDQKQYLYTQFESFHCSKVFPCFDQPNLKAKMTLCAVVPKEWVATSNGISRRFDNPHAEGKILVEKHQMNWISESDFYADKSGLAIYEFEETAKISTYLYAFCAGQYI